jgi:hypothetical protein
MTTSLEPGSLRIIARISMPMLPVGTSSHARKTSRACSHRLSAAKRRRWSSHTQSPDPFFIIVCSWLNRTGEQSTIEPPAPISSAHKPQSTTRGFVQSGFK